jgi:hypothetical protein
MVKSKKDWEYCIIRFQMRNKGEDITRSGTKQIWLVFQARKTEPNENIIVGESIEIPVPGNVIGTILTPQKDNPTHLSIHQDLIQSLQADGWELLPHHGGEWWEKRLRR